VNRFEGAYDGTPPWDIGRPQPAFVRLAEEGAIRGSVLDVGCGTGENALLFASRGHETWGLDAVPRAIEAARAKAEARGVEATFVVDDALALETLGRRFDTLTDSGVFHVFDDAERLRYVASLARALAAGGRYHMLVFSEREPAWGGPRRVAESEIREAFAGWRVERLDRARFATLLHEGEGAHAWLATLAPP